MSEQPMYTSLLVQILSSRFLPSVREMALAHPLGRMFWKAIEPEIPFWMGKLDEDKELQEQIIKNMKEFIELIEEEAPRETPEEAPGEVPSD